MSLSDIDTTRAIRTADELRVLVEAIHTSPPTAQETSWLEWKRSLDLTTKEGQFKVAKAILGFANRSSAEAHRAFEGVAYMVVGVEPGNAPGVLTVDHASLGQGLKTYVDGVRWSLHYVEFEGVTVLVVVVEDPRAGDPIHPLQKAFDKHYRGTVFHRGAAQTEPAGPKELAMLQERLLEGQRQPDLDLEFDSQADPLIRFRAEREHLKDWLRRHEAHVRAHSGEPPPPPPPKVPASQSGSLGSFVSGIELRSIGVGGLFQNKYAKPEDAKEFESRVKRHLASLRKGLVDHVVRGIVQSDDNKVTFTVGNETDDSVLGVQLTVIIPGSGLMVYGLPPDADPLPSLLPKWPDPATDYLDDIRSSALATIQDNYDFDPAAPSVVEKDGAFECTWDIGDLRPSAWSSPRTLSVVAGPNAPGEIEIQLVAKSLSHRRTATSKTNLEISSETWTIDDWLDPASGK